MLLPFWPDSANDGGPLLKEESNTPPMEVIELAVEPRRGWYLPFEFGLCADSYRGNGYSLLRVGEDGDAKLSIEYRGAGEDMMESSRPRRPLASGSTISLTFTKCHRGIIAGAEKTESRGSQVWVSQSNYRSVVPKPLDLVHYLL